MSINFEFATATRIIFGPGKFLETGSLIKPIGDSALIISGTENRYVDKLADQVNLVGLTHEIFHVSTEPTISLIKEGIEISRQSGCEMVIGIGGGSVVDAGKAIAALTTNPGKLLDYLEVIGAGKTLKIPPLPYIAIPTTAGTGAEVTRNAVLSSPYHRVKVSLRSSMMLPTLAIIDPALIKEIASIMTGNAGTPAVKSVDWIKDLVDSLNLPSLSEFGIRSTEFPEIIDKAQGASSMKGNPIKLTRKELCLILEKSMQ